MRILIQDARMIDDSGAERVIDLYIENGRFAAPPETIPADTKIIPAQGGLAVPGLIDLHVHLREPGGEEAETIASGAQAAAAGGFSAVVAMPNTSPPIDTPERVAFVLERGQAAGCAHVMTTACLTRDRAGKEVAPLAELKAAGAVAFSDDGCTVQDDKVMRSAMEQAVALGLPVMDHAQDRVMELQGGVMHDGVYSKQWGLPGIPVEAERRIVERDIRLAEETGCALHIQHVSAGVSVDLIRDAKARGVRVTAEATPHHLWFCDEDIDPNEAGQFKMNPPLRSETDRKRIREGVRESVLDVLATDHAPHSATKKALGFLNAPFGIIGLETALGATYTQLVKTGVLTVAEWVRAWTVTPWSVLGRAAPSFAPGEPADFALLDLDTEWIVDARRLKSLSRNTPYLGVPLWGRPAAVMYQGRWIHL